MLGSLPLFYFSLFKAPVAIIDNLEKLRRRFLWGGSEEKNKINWVAWKVILGDKANGGLGVGSLVSLNWALLVKWLWRFEKDKSGFWRNVIGSIHNSDRHPVGHWAKKAYPGIWYSIVNIISNLDGIGIGFSSVFDFQVGDGGNILFWLDDWLGSGALACKFPEIFDLDKKKSCRLMERWSNGNFKGAWKRKPSSPSEISELNELGGIINAVSSTATKDAWRSKLSGDGKFYVRDLRALIDKKITTPNPNPTVWCPLVPVKCTSFVWRACMGRIPTTVELAKRGLNIPSQACLSCDSGLDETNHILLDCHVAADALDWILKWCDVPSQKFNTVSEFVNFAANWGNCPKKKKIFIAICYGFLWSVWKARNDKRFNNIRCGASQLVDNVFNLVFGWLKYRGNFGNCK